MNFLALSLSLILGQYAVAESTQSAIQEMEHQTQKSECKFLRPANNRSIELSIERARNVIGIEEKNNE
jgi:hypothetical protein